MNNQDLLKLLPLQDTNKILQCEDITAQILKDFIRTPEDFNPVTFVQIANHLLHCPQHQRKFDELHA